MKTLDLDAVQTFALVATLLNFTRVAEATGTTQSAVSLKLKRLETFLDRHLVERGGCAWVGIGANWPQIRS